MIRFLDGPAIGQTLLVRRAPIYLRVTHNVGWDALDQLKDAPEPQEQVYAYRRAGPKHSLHLLCARGRNGANASGWYESADYRFIDPQPPEEILRDNPRWREWAERERQKDNAASARK